MKFYTDNEIEAVYKMEDAINDVKKILVDLKENKIISKERTVIEVPGTQNTMLYMPCVNNNSKFSILKTISIFPGNSVQPVSQGVTLLSELKNGTHVANLESSYLTRLRTGAMSAIATDQLSNPLARVLAVIGTGGMAFEQVLGVLEIRDIKVINLFNRTTAKAEKFKERLIARGVTAEINISTDASDAVSNADIINCATRSEEAVLKYKDIQPNVHINGVGSYLPEMREIDIDAIENAKTIVLDDLDGAKHEAGEFIHAAAYNQFKFEDAYLLKDIANIPQSEGITIFKSVGAAYYDLAVTVGAYEKLK